MELGNNIKYLRLEKKINQYELAKVIGVSQKCISLWESNSRVPNVLDCYKLAKFFNVSIESLITGEFF